MKPSSRSMRKAQREQFEAKRGVPGWYSSGVAEAESHSDDDAPFNLPCGEAVNPSEPWQMPRTEEN